MRTDTDVPNTILVKLGAAMAALALAIPAAASAADGATADPAGPPPPSPGGLSFDDPTAPTVFADGSTLTAPLGELVGSVVALQGSVAGSHPGDTVQVQRLDPAAGWVPVATAIVGPDGSYDASWTADRAGRTSVRATLTGQVTSTVRAAATVGTAGEGRAMTVYRRAKVTWFGPGFYGKRTACGSRMSRTLLGVASKSLPCGTLVELYNDGRTITVPVIDRGPFRRGTNYDLTVATAQALGVSATTTVGAVRAAPAPAPTPTMPAPAPALTTGATAAR
jgi:rare lipoprotein A